MYDSTELEHTLLSMDNLIEGYGLSLENVAEGLILKHYLDNEISIETITDHSNSIWIRTEASATKALVNLKQYQSVIMAGANRLTEELQMLSNIAGDIKVKKPTITELTIKKPIRYTVDGKFEPTNIRPLLSEFQNLLDFNQKVLLPYSVICSDLLDSVEFDETFLKDFNTNPSTLTATQWLRGVEVMESKTKDGDVETTNPVYKGKTFNANRTLTYSGPVEDFPETFESKKSQWSLLIKSLSSIKFKCSKDHTLKTGESENLAFAVSGVTNIRQRADILNGVIKRMLSKANDINKHLDNVSKLLKICSTIKDEANSVKTEPDVTTSIYPSPNRVFMEALMLLRNQIRLTFDYYNVMSIFLRLVGSLSYICDIELKAYSEPIVKPTEEPKK